MKIKVGKNNQVNQVYQVYPCPIQGIKLNSPNLTSNDGSFGVVNPPLFKVPRRTEFISGRYWFNKKSLGFITKVENGKTPLFQSSLLIWDAVTQIRCTEIILIAVRYLFVYKETVWM